MQLKFAAMFLGCLALYWPASATGSDSSIKREIRKEPKYTAKRRVYCLLTFAAKRRLPVSVVVDGDRLYVDRNANGDLTEAGERFDGKPKREITTELTHTDLRRRYSRIRIRWANSERRKLLVVSAMVGGKYRLESIQDGDTLASSPQKAPIIDFGGPLRLFITDKPRHSLWRGKNARTILPVFAVLGTKSRTGAWAYVVAGSLPRNVRLVASIRYGSKKSKTDGITVTAPFDVGGANYFSVTATAPRDARPGPVTVIVDVKGWKGTRIQPASVKTKLPKFADLPVIDPPRKRRNDS
jgi:hypothetical protein